MAVELVSDGGGEGSRMATPGKDLISRKSKYKVVYKQNKTKQKQNTHTHTHTHKHTHTHDSLQGMKKGLVELANMVVVNKADGD